MTSGSTHRSAEADLHTPNTIDKLDDYSCLIMIPLLCNRHVLSLQQAAVRNLFVPSSPGPVSWQTVPPLIAHQGSNQPLPPTTQNNRFTAQNSGKELYNVAPPVADLIDFATRATNGIVLLIDCSIPPQYYQIVYLAAVEDVRSKTTSPTLLFG